MYITRPIQQLNLKFLSVNCMTWHSIQLPHDFLIIPTISELYNLQVRILKSPIRIDTNYNQWLCHGGQQPKPVMRTELHSQLCISRTYKISGFSSCWSYFYLHLYIEYLQVWLFLVLESEKSDPTYANIGLTRFFSYTSPLYILTLCLCQYDCFGHRLKIWRTCPSLHVLTLLGQESEASCTELTQGLN